MIFQLIPDCTLQYLNERLPSSNEAVNNVQAELDYFGGCRLLLNHLVCGCASGSRSIGAGLACHCSPICEEAFQESGLGLLSLGARLRVGTLTRCIRPRYAG